MEKSVAICEEIGHRGGEAVCYRNLGVILYDLRKYPEEIGSRPREASSYLWLGRVYYELKEYAIAETYIKKGLGISEISGISE